MLLSAGVFINGLMFNCLEELLEGVEGVREFASEVPFEGKQSEDEKGSGGRIIGGALADTEIEEDELQLGSLDDVEDGLRLAEGMTKGGKAKSLPGGRSCLGVVSRFDEERGSGLSRLRLPSREGGVR